MPTRYVWAWAQRSRSGRNIEERRSGKVYGGNDLDVAWDVGVRQSIREGEDEKTKLDRRIEERKKKRE